MPAKLIPFAIAMFMAGCANQPARQSQPTQASVSETKAAEPASDTRIVKSRNGGFEGEIVGAVPANSKFAKLQIGMTMGEVSSLIGAPDDLHRHETGKRWIPFYFGNDSQRLQAFYKGEGCLTYTGGNVFGSGSNELIRIAADAKGRCFYE